MYKQRKKIFAIFTIASIFLTIFLISGCSETPIDQKDGASNQISKITSFTMPAGATLVSASLKLYSWSWMGTPHNVDVHSVTESWLCPSWDSIAADFDPAIITTFDMSGIGPHWNTIDITATVQAWLSGAINYGLLLKNHDAYAGTDQLGQFLSNDYFADPTLRPYLEIVTTAGTFEVEPLADTYIHSLSNEVTFCTEEQLYIGYVDVGTGLAEKRPLIQFDLESSELVCCDFHMEVSGASLVGTDAKHNFKLSCDVNQPGQSLEIVMPDIVDPYTGQTVYNVKFKTDKDVPGSLPQNTCYNDPGIVPDDPAVAFNRIVGSTLGTLDHGVQGIYIAEYEFRDGGKVIGDPNGDAGYWKITVFGGPYNGTVIGESDPGGVMTLLDKSNHKAKPNAW